GGGGGGGGGGAGGGGRKEPERRAPQAGGRKAAEKAVARDGRGARAGARGGDGRRQSGRAAADHDDVVAQRADRHPIPSRIVSMMRVMSSARIAPSTQDTTRLFLAPPRLKNTPTPRRGRPECAG